MEYGGSPEYQLAYGRMQLQMEHYDEALARLTKMVADCKAEITRKQGSTDPAERKAAGQLRRRFAVYEVELALAQLFASQNATAIETIARIRKENPADVPPSSSEFEAIALVRLGKAADARGALEAMRTVNRSRIRCRWCSRCWRRPAATNRPRPGRGLDPATDDRQRSAVAGDDREDTRREDGQGGLRIWPWAWRWPNSRSYRQPALRLVGNALTELPDEPFIMWRKIDLLGDLDRFDEALALLDRLAARSAEPAPTFEQGADVRADGANGAGRDQAAQAAAAESKAIETCQAILAKDPPQPITMNYMATIVLRQGKRDQANDIYRKLIEVDRQLASLQYLAWNLVESDRERKKLTH
jgi:tetratricopeptide (TPR) repeat protein